MRDLQTEDLFHFSRIMKKMDLKPALKGLFVDVTGKTKEDKTKVKNDTAVMLTLTVIENLDLAKKEIYEFLGDLLGKKPEEVKTMSLKETTQVLQELFSKEEFTLFFNISMQ